MNILTKFHEDWTINVASRELEMAQQRPTRLIMGPCIVEIDCIVIREVQYQLEVNGCKNKEVIVKGNFGRVWPMWAGCPRIDRIVIREVQYQFEVNQCINEEIIVKGNFGRVWSMWAWRPRFDRFVIREVQYQFEVNQLNGFFWWVWPMWAGAPGLGLGPCIVEIDPNVITKVQYQFEVNPCRNEKIIVNGNFGGCGLCGRGAPGLGMGPCMVEIDRIVIGEVQYQFEVNRCRNKEVNDGRTDRRTDGRRRSPQYPHLFFKKRGDKNALPLGSNVFQAKVIIF
ncbi:hypothetical protein DPMN_006433 [Dreissena polymorpha]|uniref:Uncharacterized protein n=1 Tax=Dreissena polymorpha TaxID=45954 RepID=A0A9D4RXG6_DREPO|nr:hypothetical protein DPMN_006433 [Dreissena polymorpha]